MASDPARIQLVDARLFVRPARLRIPFGFGVVTLREVEQAVLKVQIRDAAGREAVGISAECLLPKWFDKNPGLSDAENVAQLKRSLEIATRHYLDAGLATPFALSAEVYPVQRSQCAAESLSPLVASYGPALLDRAIIDALGVMREASFAEIVSTNLAGIDQRLTPDLSCFDLDAFLASLRPRADVYARHTVGLHDPLEVGERSADAPADGLPFALEEVIAAYGCRYFKLKACGDLDRDIDRLERIAAVLDRHCSDYVSTLDGNEQYGDVDGIAELWNQITTRRSLDRLAKSFAFIEQPIRRDKALAEPVAALSQRCPIIIDESDNGMDAFPQALELGYQGVSSKSCKGFYKSILNAARVSSLNAKRPKDGPFILSGEDLMTLSGLSTQQDLALVSVLGIRHVERNGHHYVDGMSFAPPEEQEAMLAAHPDLYHRPDGGPVRLRIEQGRIAIGSIIDEPGLGLATDRDLIAGSFAAAPEISA